MSQKPPDVPESNPFAELRRVLAESAELLAGGAVSVGEGDPMAARTRQLARPHAADAADERLNVLTFRLGAERYGWRVTSVRSITRLGKLTPVPSAPPYYRGVTSVRGAVLSVLDVRAYLGLGVMPGAAAPMLIVISGAGLEIGTLADEVFDVAALRADEWTRSEGELISGVTADGLSILDAEALLGREAARIRQTS